LFVTDDLAPSSLIPVTLMMEAIRSSEWSGGCLLVTDDVAPSSLIVVTLLMEAIRSSERSGGYLLVTDDVASSSLIVVTLMMEAIRSSERYVCTRATRSQISEEGIPESHYRENLKSYIGYFVLIIVLFHSK
jgi:hypothetical protein